MVAFVACIVGGIGIAAASPQSNGNPNVTLEVSPGDGANLSDGQAIMVAGQGFAQGGFGVSGVVRQTAVLPDASTASGLAATPFTSNGSGTFGQNLTVTRMFQASGAAGPSFIVDCGDVQQRIVELEAHDLVRPDEHDHVDLDQHQHVDLDQHVDQHVDQHQYVDLDQHHHRPPAVGV